MNLLIIFNSFFNNKLNLLYKTYPWIYKNFQTTINKDLNLNPKVITKQNTH